MSLSEVFLTDKKSAITEQLQKSFNLNKPKHRQDTTPKDWRKYFLGCGVSRAGTQPEIINQYKTGANLNKSIVFGLVIVFGLTNVSAFFVIPGTNASAASHSASITTSGAQSIDVAPSATGGTGASISADDITVTTTCRAGYNLTISTSVDDNNLYLDGNKTSSAYFTPATGSTELSESPNTWGFLMADSVPQPGNIFNAVPRVDSPTTIRTPLSTPSDTDIHDEFSVYYGVAVSNSMTPGAYRMIPDSNNNGADGTIIYRLTLADACTAYTVSFSPSSIFEGNELTGTGAVSSQTIYEGLSANLTSQQFTAPSGYYFAGWNTEPDGTGTQYLSGQSVTDLASVGETITLYAMWNDCPPGRICYDKNIDSAIGSMGEQLADSDSEVTLLASNFSSGDPTNVGSPGDYGFAGWSTKKLNPTDTDFRTQLLNATNAGQIYGPNETINVGSTDSSGKKLYAVWLPVAKNSNGTDLTFQTSNLLNVNLADDTGGTTLSAKPIGYVTALRDQRDNQVYAVAKLADGKYWMTENLRLNHQYTVGNNLNHSDVTNASLAQGYGISADYGNFSGLATSETTNFKATTTGNSLYYSGTQSGTASVDIGTSDYPNYRIPRYNDTNTSARATSPSSSNAEIYSYGNYYTWSAALANTTYYSTATMKDANDKTSETVATSICPKGWTLPRGGNKTKIEKGTSDLYPLNFAVVNSAPENYDDENQPYWSDDEGVVISKALRRYPTNLIFSGYYSDSQPLSRGTYGYFWSSTSSNPNNAYYMHLDNSYVNPGTYGNSKNYGFTIRCLASE